MFFRVPTCRTDVLSGNFVCKLLSGTWILLHHENVTMAALHSRCGHYIFILWFLLAFVFFSSPNLSGCRLHIYHTSTHGVALVRI